MRKKPTILDLRSVITENYEAVPKLFGKELVDLGFLNYSKLTPENYDYWWCEVDDIKNANPLVCTYNWEDMKQTNKLKITALFIDYHQDDETAFHLIY